MKPNQKLHYAWVICLCCSLAMFCVAGLTSTLLFRLFALPHFPGGPERRADLRATHHSRPGVLLGAVRRHAIY